MGAAVSISHWFFIDFSLFMTLWAWLVFMFTEQSFIWCIFWKKFLPKFSWRYCLLSWRAAAESESWRLDSYELVHVNSSVDLLLSLLAWASCDVRDLEQRGNISFLCDHWQALLPRTLGGEGRVLDDRVSCIFLLQFSPSFMLLDISWYMTYKQHWRKVGLSSISTDVDIVFFCIITNSNLPAKEGSRGGWGTGDQSASFTFPVQCQLVMLPGISWPAIAKNWLRRRFFYSIWTKVNLCFFALLFFAVDGWILFSY